MIDKFRTRTSKSELLQDINIMHEWITLVGRMSEEINLHKPRRRNMRSLVLVRETSNKFRGSRSCNTIVQMNHKVSPEGFCWYIHVNLRWNKNIIYFRKIHERITNRYDQLNRDLREKSYRYKNLKFANSNSKKN